MMGQCDFFPFKGYEQEYAWNPTTEEARGLKSGKILKWNYDKQGRPYITLCKNGVKRNFYKAMCIYSFAHQCEIPLLYQVHHINGCWTDNDPRNLQLLTAQEHMELHAKERSKAVVGVDEKGNVVYRFASTWEADRNGFNQGGVAAACRGCYSTHRGHYYKGYYWYFEDEWARLFLAD